MEGRQREQHAGQAHAAVVGVDAKLGDVAALIADAGTEDEGDELAGTALNDNMRNLGREDAATCVADDVVKKALRAVVRAVLVVDDAVWVATVGLRDEAAGGGEIVFAPGAKLQAGGQIGGWVGPDALELLDEEEAAKNLEARFAEEAGVLARGMEQEL